MTYNLWLMTYNLQIKTYDIWLTFYNLTLKTYDIRHKDIDEDDKVSEGEEEEDDKMMRII